MKQIRSSILTLISVAALAGILYSFWPTYWLTWICIAALLFAFLTAVQLQPAPIKRCPQCGATLNQRQGTISNEVKS